MDDSLDTFYAEWESVIDENGNNLPLKETKMQDKYYAKFIKDDPSMKENPDLDKIVTVKGCTESELVDLAKAWDENNSKRFEIFNKKSSSPSPLKIKVKSINGGKIPSKAKVGDAAIDLYADSTTLTVASPGGRVLISTGICMEIPDGWFGLILGRSGNAVNKGFCILGGVIDSGYRGEIKVVVLNTGQKQQWFNAGDKIAQMVFLPVPTIEIEAVEELDSSERGSNGFGSTGN